MRLKIATAIFALWAGTASFSLALTPPKNLIEYNRNKTQYLQETLKDGKKVSDYFTYLSQIRVPSFITLETFYRRQSTHNPFVWRQGIGAPGVPGAAIPGLPFDITTPAGTIPGCLNLLCPPPAAALWYAGICWCG